MSNVKNVQALEQLLGICTGLGGEFNPGNQNLQLKVLTAMLDKARQIMHDEKVALAEYDNATNLREVTFGNLGKLSTRIIGALTAAGAMPQTVDDARTMVRKLASKLAKDREAIASVEPKEDAEKTNPATRRARGGDFGSKPSHFAKLLETLSAEPKYHPNVEDLKLESLTDLLKKLNNLNSRVHLARANVSRMRIVRNEVLYRGVGNVFDTAKSVKAYVKSRYGATSEQYKSVRRIRFTKPKL